MEEFLTYTTIHGLRGMARGSQICRVIWGAICSGIYAYLVWSIYKVCRNYMDPKNLKTMISFGSGPGDVTNGSAIDPARYPRLVLCAENPIADINKYNVAEVQYGEDYVKPDIRPFPPLRLTYARKRLKYDWAFRSLEMCATFEFGKVIHINWHGVEADLKAYMSVGDSEATEPVGEEPRITRSVRGLSERFACSLEPNKSLVIRMKTISVHEIYVGPGSTFCNSYPQHVRPYLPAYDIGHCVDLLYLQWLRESGKKTCYRKYKMILDELKDSKGGWKSAEAYGCRLKHSSRSRSALYLDCGCSPDSWTEGPGEEKARNQALVDEHCKRSHMNIIWSESVKTKNRTDGKSKVSFKFVSPQFIKTTQVPAMNWEDVLSQIGGFLGLLIGASMISFLELFEFVLISIGGRIRRRNKPVNPGESSEAMSQVETENDDQGEK